MLFKINYKQKESQVFLLS